MYVGAVVPTIDEADTIGDLVRALDKVCDQLVVVDGSNDSRTWKAAEQAGATVEFDHGGLGRSYRAGWEHVDPDWYLVHIDAGGSHDPAELYPMLDLADEGFDVVIGSRFCAGGKHLGGRRRRFTSKIAAGALNTIYGYPNIHDWTSGYRVYSPRARRLLRDHTFTTSGHAWQIESLWVLRQAGMRVVEHPITYHSSVSQLSTGRVKEAASLWWKLART